MARKRIHTFENQSTRGEKISDMVTDFVGSWKFIIFQTCVFLFWISLNLWGILHQWDPYPFIFLNLVLALETVYSTPLVMMSQNRQESKDRVRDDADYEADMAAEENTKRIQIEVLQIRKEIAEIRDILTKNK